MLLNADLLRLSLKAAVDVGLSSGGVRDGVRAEAGSDSEEGCISGSGSRPHWSIAFTRGRCDWALCSASRGVQLGTGLHAGGWLRPSHLSNVLETQKVVEMDQ